MNEKLKYFTYSQNSLNTYKSCPFKFKYKYIDNINWRYDDLGSREYYDSMKYGRDFHLLCERYFSSLPIGNNNKKFEVWLKNIEKILPLKDDNIYLPEYEVRLKIGPSEILAKYDLIIIEPNKISIWDWKTENREISYKNAQNRMQTIVYMFLAEEVIRKQFYPNYNIESININYYQPEINNRPITITYGENIHNENILKISKFINDIESIDFDDETSIIKNKNHCKYCEFNKLCNNEEINYEILEEDIYGA